MSVANGIVTVDEKTKDKPQLAGMAQIFGIFTNELPHLSLTKLPSLERCYRVAKGVTF